MIKGSMIKSSIIKSSMLKGSITKKHLPPPTYCNCILPLFSYSHILLPPTVLLSYIPPNILLSYPPTHLTLLSHSLTLLTSWPPRVEKGDIYENPSTLIEVILALISTNCTKGDDDAHKWWGKGNHMSSRSFIIHKKGSYKTQPSAML